MGSLFTYGLMVAVAVIYAGLRLWHDSHLSGKSWKLSEGVEMIFFSILIPGIWLHFSDPLQWFTLTMIFALWWWLVFDIICGMYWGGSPWYLGQYDSTKKIFVNGRLLALYKGIWLIMFTAFYFYEVVV